MIKQDFFATCISVEFISNLELLIWSKDGRIRGAKAGYQFNFSVHHGRSDGTFEGRVYSMSFTTYSENKAAFVLGDKYRLSAVIEHAPDASLNGEK